MADIARILCPVDFSEPSRHALDQAVAIARWHGASVTVLHVVPPLGALAPALGAPLYPPIADSPGTLDDVRSELEAFVRTEGGAGVPVDVVVVIGTPATTIADWSESSEADLIVLGTHGRSGVERLLLGSVTERVLRRASCPVLTVPPRLPDAVPSGAVLFRHILCGIDFSPASERALAYARSLAKEAELTILHVMEAAMPRHDFAVSGAVHAATGHAGWSVAAQRLDDLISADVTACGYGRELITSGKPCEQILRIAAQDAADLIVIGVHERSSSFVSGSTTMRVVRNATCPVLTLKA